MGARIGTVPAPGRELVPRLVDAHLEEQIARERVVEHGRVRELLEQTLHVLEPAERDLAVRIAAQREANRLATFEAEDEVRRLAALGDRHLAHIAERTHGQRLMPIRVGRREVDRVEQEQVAARLQRTRAERGAATEQRDEACREDTGRREVDRREPGRLLGVVAVEIRRSRSRRAG